MKIAKRVSERIEDYNYYSSGFSDPRALTIRVLAVRLNGFHTVMKRASDAAKKSGGSPTGKTQRRRLR